MRSSSIFVFTFMIFNGLISAHPSINLLGSHSDTVNLLNRRLLSATSKIPPLSHKRKRGLFRKGRNTNPRLMCDSTFYKQSKVDAVAARDCKKAQGSSARSGRNSSKTGLRPFEGSPSLFPGENQRSLTMIPITNSFFPVYKIKNFLKTGKNDFVVLSDRCRVVGIVRQLYGKDFVRCTSTQNTGGSTNTGFPQPVRPAGAFVPNNGQANSNPYTSGVTSPGLANIARPVRPAGASVPNNGQANSNPYTSGLTPSGLADTVTPVRPQNL